MRRKLACLAILLALTTGCLLAQNDDTTTRSVEGVVTDAGGSPVAQAVVQLKNTKTLAIRSFITTTDGQYHFAGLSTNDEYELKATKEGASSGSKTVSVFSSKKVVVVNLKLNKS